MTQPILTIEATYSTLSSSQLLAKVVPQYKISNPVSCEFWHRGLNDTYRLSSGTDPDAEDFVLRVYRKSWRTRAAIEFELGALIYLHQKGANVAIPVKRQDGGLLTSILAPEGERYVIVMQYAKGKILRFDKAEDGITFGQAAANIHRCSAGFKSHHARHKLGLKHLVDEPLINIQPYIVHRLSDWQFLTELATRLSKLVQETDADNNLDYGFCHGDFHGENAHEHNGQVTHFDFDCCGMGWRIYDLATFKWVIRLLGKEDKLWDSFLDGYQSVRETPDLDLGLIEAFVGIRDIWFFGLNTKNSLAQGWLNDGYIDLHMGLLKGVAERLN